VVGRGPAIIKLGLNLEILKQAFRNGRGLNMGPMASRLKMLSLKIFLRYIKSLVFKTGSLMIESEFSLIGVELGLIKSSVEEQLVVSARVV